jgi:acetyl esterase
MPDYANLIDAPTWAFIRATEASYPPDTATLSIADQRAIYDRMCRAFAQSYPHGVTAQDQQLAGVPCRIYPGAAPTVLYLHGGGMVVGGLHSHDDVCAEIRAETGLTVVAADYRLLPEHPTPAALEDTLAVARHLAAQGPILLAGDSAGGFLAAAAAHALRGQAGIRILGQVLIYPGLGGDLDSGSALDHAHAPMLTRDDVLYYQRLYRGSAAGAATLVEPLKDHDFANLPPTVAIGAECDPQCDEGARYQARIRAAGGCAHFILARGLPHGFLRARTTVPRAAAAFTQITTALAALSQGDWPYGDPT